MTTKPGTKPDATTAAAAAVASDDNDDHFISAPPLEAEALPSFFPAVPAETSIYHAVGQLLVSPVTASGIICENNNNNDIQGGQGIDRDVTSGRECD